MLRRGASRVVHRHRIGSHNFRRVSDLVFVRGKPFAVLEWINMSGVRTPLFLPLDAGKLRVRARLKNTYYYDGTTSDPRFDDVD
ncbi:MAG TPA: hypothetical protein VM140_08100 [Burkholderiales bacterium]|nr:hypothetical protein [Burkholderiales bacterium]